MTDPVTLTSWLEALGLDVKEGSGASGEHLSVASADGTDPRLVVQRNNTQTWDVIHERRVPESVLSSDWHAPWDTEQPPMVVGAAAREVAYGFPLVEAETRDEGGDVTVRFHAPVFDEGLTQQGFVLTVSAVLKVAQVFDLVLTRRADEIADWKEFEAASEQRKQEQDELINRMTEVDATPEATAPGAPVPATRTPSSTDTVPAAAWSPTHVVTRRAKAWAQPDPAGARAGELKRRVPVHVAERQDDWARVITSNGWSGWIDSRDLKAR
jgi:SH3 domain-containing protein